MGHFEHEKSLNKTPEKTKNACSFAKLTKALILSPNESDKYPNRSSDLQGPKACVNSFKKVRAKRKTQKQDEEG